jgi:DNA-binding CsgD family transcriptional regulator
VRGKPDTVQGRGRMTAAMLFGRDAERAHLEELLDAVASGPAGCILQGNPGIGKTTLWRASVESAHARGYQILETAPSEPESVLAFSGLNDLFDRLPDDVFEILPEAQARAIRTALFAGELPEGSRDMQALPRAVLGVLRQLAAVGPVLIAIDDEQWLDPASARVLAFALCRLRDESIVVIVARRPEPSGALSDELRRRFAGGGLEPVPLEPLGTSTINSLLEARLERSISRPVLRRIHQVAGGNPLYALAIALELDARHAGGARAGDLPVPRTLSDAIELRLEHLDSRASSAMLAIAALSQPTLAMLQAAIPDFALSDLESAERAGVIEISGDRVRFTHPLLASTHYTNTPASKRRDLHRRLANVIEDEEERAQHVALGAEAPDREIAQTLEKAAGVAARRGATESAAQLLEDAARLTPIDQESTRNARIVAAAEHRFSSGEVSRARGMLEAVLPDLDSAPLRARARVTLASARGDEPRVGLELLEAALEDAGEDDHLRCEIDSELTAVATEIGIFSIARTHAESALSAAERLGDQDLVAKALGRLHMTFVCTGEPLNDESFTRLSTMNTSTDVATYYQPNTSLGLTLYWVGDDEAARPRLERAARRALSRGEEWDRLGVLLTLGYLEWETGNRRVAEQHLHDAADALGEYEEGFLWLVGLNARFALDKGDLATARANAERGLAVAERKGTFMHESRFIQVLAGIDALSGDPQRAHTRLEKLRERLALAGYGPAGHSKAIAWSEDVEALIAMDRLDDAEQILAELRSRAGLCSTSHADALACRCEGLLSTARGDLVGAIEAMDRALAAHARCHRPFEHGRTLLEKGAIERRAKRRAAAKQTLEQALAVLEPLGAQIWVSRIRDELSRIGLRRASVSNGLTPAQSRVAELVAAGLTNPEIARRLHMSSRTVESHLSRVYREYGVRSRSQLVAALAAPAGASSSGDANSPKPTYRI